MAQLPVEDVQTQRAPSGTIGWPLSHELTVRIFQILEAEWIQHVEEWLPSKEFGYGVTNMFSTWNKLAKCTSTKCPMHLALVSRKWRDAVHHGVTTILAVDEKSWSDPKAAVTAAATLHSALKLYPNARHLICPSLPSLPPPPANLAPPSPHPEAPPPPLALESARLASTNPTAVATLLRHAPNLTSLHLHHLGTPFRPFGYSPARRTPQPESPLAPLWALTRLTSLTLGCLHGVVRRGGFAGLSALVGLETLGIHGEDGVWVTGKSVQALRGLATVRLELCAEYFKEGVVTVPTWLAWCRNLTDLTLHDYTAPDGTWSPKLHKALLSLRRLSLSAASLALPSWLGDLTRLEDLHLSVTGLNEQAPFPTSLTRLKSLHRVTLAGFADLHPGVQAWSGLQHLALRNCGRQAAPPGLEAMFGRGELESFFSSILKQGLPEAVLGPMDAFGEPLALPPTFGNLGATLQSLRLEPCTLKELPGVAVRQLTALQELHLVWEVESSALEALPMEIGELQQLRTLVLINNGRLTRLPVTLKFLPKLRELVLRNVSLLQKLPAGLSRLTQLRLLDVYGCHELPALPPLGALSSLTALHASVRLLASAELPVGASWVGGLGVRRERKGKKTFWFPSIELDADWDQHLDCYVVGSQWFLSKVNHGPSVYPHDFPSDWTMKNARRGPCRCACRPSRRQEVFMEEFASGGHSEESD